MNKLNQSFQFHTVHSAVVIVPHRASEWLERPSSPEQSVKEEGLFDGQLRTKTAPLSFSPPLLLLHMYFCIKIS